MIFSRSKPVKHAELGRSGQNERAVDDMELGTIESYAAMEMDTKMSQELGGDDATSEITAKFAPPRHTSQAPTTTHPPG